ncbi:MAG: hypothetical protein JO353_03950 [Phycisphaerae bacterium]|nr:hypothetical protein [Phycisphaerae bacterium]
MQSPNSQAIEKRLTITLLLAADAMFLLGLLGASRVLPSHITPHERMIGLMTIAVLATGVAMGGRWTIVRQMLAAGLAVLRLTTLYNEMDIRWLLHGCLLLHLVLLAALPSPMLWKFVLLVTFALLVTVA